MNMREIMRLLRSETGLTQAELAAAVYVSFSTVSRWENKGIRPSQAASVALINLAKQRHVSAACLDLLNKALFASRADDKQDRALAAKAVETMKLEQRELLTSEQLKLTIDNLDVGILAQRVYFSAPQKIDVLYYNPCFVEMFGYPEREFEEKFAKDPYFAICPEDIRAYQRNLKKLFSGKINLKDFTIQLSAIKKDGTRFWVEVKAISLTVFSFGRELFTSCRDVTERVEEGQKYQQELRIRDISLKGFFANLHCDLTENTVLRQCAVDAMTGVPFEGESADGLFQNIARAIPEGEERTRFLNQFSCAALKASFEQNILSGNVQVFCTVAGRWLRHDFMLLKNPDTHHVEALVYSYDMQQQIFNTKLLEIISTHFFEFLGCIDVESGKIETLYLSDPAQVQPSRRLLYDEVCREQLQRLGYASDLKKELAASNLKHVCAALERHLFYSTIIRLCGPMGDLRPKKIAYTYLDGSHRQILVAQFDVSNALHVSELLRTEAGL